MVITDHVSIKPMRLEDITAVLEIEQMSFPTPWPRDAYQHELKDNRLACYLVAREFQRVLGYAGMWVILDEAHVTTIAVDPLHRRRRIGERLLVSLIDEAMRRGARWVTLEVRKSNHSAQELYRKYGFTTVTMRTGYYSDDNESALIMWAGSLRSELYGNRLHVLRARVEQA
jgi:[ribosomal protein S18]-alanine N-acetyltransferase